MMLVFGMPVMMKSLLLDTCALLWLAISPERLSADARQRISSCEGLYVSAVTLWEIAFKYRIGKLKLDLDPQSWLELAERKFALTVLPLTRKTMIDAAKLPLHHRDPADRFIIATALENDLPVLTADGNFDKYGVKTIC